MTLEVIECEETIINGLLDNLIKKGLNISSLEQCLRKIKRKVVVGKVVKVHSLSTENKYSTILLEEYLPCGEHGEVFEAVVHNKLSFELASATLQVGDSLAFYEPVVFSYCALRTRHNQHVPKYVLETGVKEDSLIWWAKGQKSNCLPLPSDPQQKSVCSKSTSQKTDGEEKKKKVHQWYKKDLESGFATKENEPDKNSYNFLKPLPVAAASNKTGVKKNCVINVNPSTDGNELNKNSNAFVTLPSTSGSNKKEFIKNSNATVKPLSDSREAGSGGIVYNGTMNPQYQYKSLVFVSSDAKSGDLKRVNLFGLVHLVVKPITKTNAGKFTIICKLVDESTHSSPERFVVHFFTKEDTVLKQIEHGDVLRLHRVQIEMYKGNADGRIFNSTDITLFKKQPGLIINMAAKTRITDAAKLRVQELRKFYKETVYPQMLSNVVSLSSVTQEGDYNVLCQLVADPETRGSGFVLRVTDGTRATSLYPSKRWQCVDNIVTHILCVDVRNMLHKFKAEDTLLIHDVKVEIDTDNDGKFSLIIDSPIFYVLMDKDDKKVLEIKKRIEELKKNKGLQDKDAAVGSALGNNSQVNGSLNSSSEKREQSTRVLRKRGSPQDQDAEPNNGASASKISASKSKSGKRTRERRARSEEGKTRKALFSANNADWSDATDEVSVISNTHKSDTNKDTEVKNPGNVSMDTIADFLVTKYCCPRKIFIQDQVPSKSPAKSKGDEDRSDLSNLQPVVSLKKLTENESSHTNGKKLEQCGSDDKRRKGYKRLGDPLQEESEDASTVLNMKRPKRFLNESQQIKRDRRERSSTMFSDGCPAGETLASLETTPHAGEKVTSWLSRLGDTLSPQDTGSEELESSATRVLLGGEDYFVDKSPYLNSLDKRLKVFLLDTTPDINGLPEDFVSGYCDSGCRNLYMSSVIRWTDDTIPICPSCIKLHQERELVMMFMFQLKVLDLEGKIEHITVCREHGETFFNCSVKDYLREEAVSSSRLQLLKECCLRTSWSSTQLPLMDITLCQVRGEMCLMNTRLLPPTC